MATMATPVMIAEFFQCDEIIRSLEYISKIVKNNMPWKAEEIAEDIAHIL